MFCGNCGKEIVEGNKFCTNCGSPVESDCQTISSVASAIKSAKCVTEYPDDTFVDKMDTVKFGKYPQSDTSGKKEEDIEWLVLDKCNDKALLISKKVIDQVPFYYYVEDDTINDKKIAYYKTSFIRKFLNDEFYNNAFNSSEKELIADADVESTMYSGQSKWEVYNNIDEIRKKYNNCDFTTYDLKREFLIDKTTDKVFLINYEQYVNYFGKERIVLKTNPTMSRYDGKDHLLFGHDRLENIKGSAEGTEYLKTNYELPNMVYDLKKNCYSEKSKYQKEVYTGYRSVNWNEESKDNGVCWFLNSIDFTVKDRRGDEESYMRPIFVGTHGDVACANSGCCNGYGLRPAIWVRF